MIEKKPSPKGKSVRVTFALPADKARERAAVVGDFNDWNEDANPMKLDEKRGVWTTSVSLKPGNTYQFRYRLDGERWENDDQADRYESNPYFSENSVVEVRPLS
jgi:1,4-alpha-glucan branching enzyme